jgi:hypothetical protein
MADELPESHEPANEPVLDFEAAAATPPPRRRRRWKWPLILLGAFVLVPVTIFALWTWFALHWTYSRGDRAGYVQKFSDKGWICKTWEGELSMVNIPGAAQERWAFSVRDDSVARAITKLMGSRVSLSYEEKRGIPTSCFGETEYFVNGVRKLD